MDRGGLVTKARPSPSAHKRSGGGGNKANAAKLWLGYGALSAGLEVTRLVAESLFITRIGIRHLPTIFAIQALLRVVGSWAYVHRAERLGARSLIVWALSWMAVAVVLPSVWAGAMGSWWPYAIIYATVEAADTVIKVHWGVYLLELYRPGEAKALFPLLYTAASLGRSLGGTLVRQTAATALLAWLPAASLSILLPLAGIFLLGASRPRPKGPDRKKRPAEPETRQWSATDRLLIKPLPAGGPKAAPRRPAPEVGPDEAAFELVSPLSSVRKALALLRSSRLVRAIALATLLLVLTRFLVRYVSLALLRTHLDTAGMARLLGTYSALAHLGGLAIQILVTPKLTRRLGITATNSLFAVLLWTATLALSIWGRVTTALTARFAESEAKTAIKTPISPIFYYPVPTDSRPAARALILGVVSPASAVLTALILELLQTTLSLSWLAALATACATALLLATFQQNREYNRLIGAKKP